MSEDPPRLEVQQSHGPVTAPGRHDLRVEVQRGDSASPLDVNIPHHPGPRTAQSRHGAVSQATHHRHTVRPEAGQTQVQADNEDL